MTCFPDGLEPWVRPDEQCVALTESYRLLQPLDGHRYSVDDMLVAHLACTSAPRAARVLDLGCGIGSVLLMVAWAEPGATLVGVEALREHEAVARRNVLLNGCESRVRVVGGDLRDEALVAGLGTFDLVTATPPYFDPRATTVSRDLRRAAAHWELRGGIEAYASAAAAALSPAGLFVTCAAFDPPGRAAAAFAAVGLEVVWSRDVLPRTGKRPFLLLLVGSREGAPCADEAPPLVLRDADGSRTAEHASIRRWFGVDCGTN